MKKKILIPSAILSVLAIILTICTGCGNKTVFDTNYTFDKANIYLNGEWKTIDIKEWDDYEGEQLQIIDTDGRIYLTSSYNCILIKEPE